MNNKHNPYLRLFTRDIEGSPKINALSMAASGLYFRLLNRFNEPPMPGSLALHDWEVHHTWQRSLTQQCLAASSDEQRLLYFAKYLSRIFQWKSADILKALQELYFFGIVVVEGDRLIQPRMYKDNGYKLQRATPDDAEIDAATGAASVSVKLSDKSEELSCKQSDKNTDKKSDKKNTRKTVEKTTAKSGTTHARVHALSSENENNKVVVDSSSSSGSSKVINKAKAEKTITKKMTPVADCPPSLDDVILYFAERRQQEKPLEYISPEEFYAMCETSGWTRGKNGQPIYNWKSYALQCDIWRQNHSNLTTVHRTDKNAPTGTKNGSTLKQGVQVTEINNDKYKDGW